MSSPYWLFAALLVLSFSTFVTPPLSRSAGLCVYKAGDACSEPPQSFYVDLSLSRNCLGRDASRGYYLREVFSIFVRIDSCFDNRLHKVHRTLH